MPQSSVIAAYLMIAFLVFITMRGELQAYMGFLLSSPAVGGSAGASAQQSSNAQTAQTAVQFAELANTAIEAAG